MECDSENVYASSVSDSEWSSIPSETAKKMKNLIDELLTSKAISETNRFRADENLAELQGKFETIDCERENLSAKLDAAAETISELESQISTCTADVARLQSACKKSESEAADFRHQRNLAVDERNDLSKMIERRNTEIERLQLDMATLSKRLEFAINERCEAIAHSEEISSMKLSLEYKEKRLDQERSLLNNQVEFLTENLRERTDELLNMKRDNTSRCAQLEMKLVEKTQEFAIATETIKSITEINNNLTAKVEELTDRLKNQHDVDAKTHELYHQEVEAQTKLAELYRGMCEESKQHGEELANAVAELQSVLRDATEKYGDLETKHKECKLANEEILAKKNECITMLKQELEGANEILKIVKDETLQKDLEDLSPSAAATSRIMKSGMSMTQIYNQYISTAEELAQEKEESRRLNSYIQHIISEIEQKGPLLKKQREDYESALDTIKEMTKQIDTFIVENQQLRDEALECKRAEGVATRENARLKKDITDLGRQVCHLLREVELSRAGSSSTSTDQDLSDSISSGDIITKRLVTFSDIPELQSTNQRLLALVRELSAKQEEAEAYDPATIAKMKMKLESFRDAQENLLAQQESNNKMLSMVSSQRDLYKSLYEQSMKDNGENVPMQLESPYIPERRRSQSPKPQDETDLDDKLQELETELEKAKNEIKMLKEEADTYRKEKSENEKLLVAQMESMRNEVREVTRQNSRLTMQSEVAEERFKVMQSNMVIYKTQITALEKQNKIYSESIVKHENSSMYLKDEIFQVQKKFSQAEVLAGNLQKENALLKDSESRLLKERESLKKEFRAHTLMHTNIELIKATLERNDAESRIRLEANIDEAHRECAALRRRLQEEQDRFRELTEHLENQTKIAQERMEEERHQACKLREDLAELREELIAKSAQIEDLTKKLKSSLMMVPDGTVEGRKFRELERMLNDSEGQIELLENQLKSARQTVEQHCDVAQGAEQQLKLVMEEHDTYRKNTEAKLAENTSTIAQLKEECSELQGELSIQNDGQDVAALDFKSRSNRLESDLKSTTGFLAETRVDLEEARSDIIKLSASLETAEQNYAREMMLHSNDVQALAVAKEQLSKVLDELSEVKLVRDKATEALEQNVESWRKQEDGFTKEKLEIETRLKEINTQNSLLLDQIQHLNTQLSLLQARATEPQNVSRDGHGDSSFNHSFAEDDVKSSDQLLKIIKFLRQEKDISVSKCEILDAEYIRLKSQYDSVCKQLEDAKAALESERQTSEVSLVSSAKHAEVLRKIETLNAITDSNRTLRVERDALASQIGELKARTSLLEEQLAPLQEKNRELSLKADAMHTENITLRGEATRWRQRANMLVEKSNRTSPEDWKKLQNERENLSKQLIIERGTTTKLNDDLNNLRQDKGRLEDQLKNLRVQHNQQHEELQQTREEVRKLKEQIGLITQEFEQLKVNHCKLVEDNRLLTEDTAGKDGIITEFKSNLVAVRKIAKKYKTQCEEQAKQIGELKDQNEEVLKSEASTTEKEEKLRINMKTEFEERISQLDHDHNTRVSELTQQVTSANEENETSKKEIESLKQTNMDKEERFKALFKNAKDRIMSLTEQNNNLRSEVNQAKAGKSSDTTQPESNNAALAAELERLQQEKEEIIAEKQQERERLTQEIETLTQRVNQLQRQLGQQSSKPSTSSGPSDKPTSEPPTANIKPMAGHSTNTQTQSVPIQPWRSGSETPLASIRPMSMQLRTVAVLPTSQGASTTQGTSAVIVPPQQQVHTTGPSTSSIEGLSSSPTSSHTEYMPATSSATPAVVGPRQVAVPPTQSTQDAEDEDTNMQVQTAPQQQAVALVLPRVEPPSSGSAAQESGTSSSSSNTVTTTQAGLKRPREADTDSSCQADEQTKSQQQTKRSRVQGQLADNCQSQVSDSCLEVEYQVPTSSQRDHEEDPDAVIVVESDDEGDGPDEGEGADDDPDDPDTEGYDMETYPEQELNYEDADCQDMDDEEEEAGNEVEVIEDSSEVPNQSEQMQDNQSQEENNEQAQSEAISSGTDGTAGVTLSQASPSVAVTMPSFTRTRQVAPLSRQQQQTHLLLPHGIEESGDDGIVPSTPTLFVPRRSDGFGEAVSSPHVPTSGRFTFSESAPPNNAGSTEVIPEQTLEFSHTDDNSTGRSVPSTPLQASPQESGPGGEEPGSLQNPTSEAEIPTITVSGASDEAESAADGSSAECMGPPSTAGTSGELSQPGESSADMLEGEDAVSSEGEKLPATEESEEEGREAEASPSTNTRSRGQYNRGGVARRNIRNPHGMRGLQRPGPTPIIWEHQHSQQRLPSTRSQESMVHRGGRGASGPSGYSPRGVARRSRGRSPRPYGRF